MKLTRNSTRIRQSTKAASCNLWNNPDMPNASTAPASELLSGLRPGDIATIVGLHTADDALRQRLLALGMRTGRSIIIMRQAPFGGPLQVRLGSTDLLIRINEADMISVRKT